MPPPFNYSSLQQVSDTRVPLKLDPHLIIAFYPQFEAYEKTLRGKGTTRTAEEEYVLQTVGVLLDYLRKDYRATLARIANLTTHGEITSDLLYAILVPRTIIVTECPTTGEPRALRLLSSTMAELGEEAMYTLLCESIDSTEQGALPGRNTDNSKASTVANAGARRRLAGRRAARRGTAQSTGSNARTTPGLGAPPFGMVQTRIVIAPFKGTVKINSLEVFPIEYHDDSEGLKADLIARGKKWAALRGIHHVHYDGMGARTVVVGRCKKVLKYNVCVLYIL